MRHSRIISALALTGVILAGCGDRETRDAGVRDDTTQFNDGYSQGTGYGTPGTEGGTGTPPAGAGEVTIDENGGPGAAGSGGSTTDGSGGTGVGVGGSGTGMGGTVDTGSLSERNDTQGLGTGIPGSRGPGGTGVDTAFGSDTAGLGTGAWDTSRSGMGGTGPFPDTASTADTSISDLPGAGSGGSGSGPAGSGPGAGSGSGAGAF